LTWKKGDKARARPLPVGTYRLTGYRLVRGEWMASATGGREAFEVSAGKTTKLEIGARVNVRFRARPKGQALSLGMGIRGRKGMGLSLYHKGTRIQIRYRLSSQGEKPQDGPMNYG
jgi:hypothetical protein